MSIIRARSPYHIKHTSTVETSLPVLTCADVTITGLSIAADGTITNPTVTGATFVEVIPSSFDTVTTDTVQTVTVVSSYNPSTHLPPYETSNNVYCDVTATQPGTTPAIEQGCREYEIINFDASRNTIVTYYDCSNTYQLETVINDGLTHTICVYQGTQPYVNGISGNNNFVLRQTDTTCT